MTKPERLEISEEELTELLGRVESGQLEPGDFETIKAMAETISFLSNVVDQKGVQLKRLLRALFGSSSEKRESLLGAEKSQSIDSPPEESGAKPGDPLSGDDPSESDPKKGHGRRAASEYTGAEVIDVEHDELRAGDDCPRCEKGTVYKQLVPKTIVRVRGSAPLRATVHRFERFRCNICGEVFTARIPEDLGDEKYDETVASSIALLKYGSGLPFHRLERLQEAHGIPLPSSTQWEIVEKAEKLIAPAYDELFREAAQGELVYSDDTTVRILELMGKRREKLQDPPARVGLYTTGLVSRIEDRTIALYFSGSEYAGENLAKLLSIREPGQDPPIQMSDGLSHNKVAPGMTVVANCLAHGRRQFVDILESFPGEARHFVDVIAEIYAVEKRAREEELGPEQRLALHQAESRPAHGRTEDLARRSDRGEEGRGELGSRQGDSLRREAVGRRSRSFFANPAPPLDNSLCERVLKKAILNRKNSLFFKTRKGATTGDRYLSLIHTAELCRENSFEYLTALQRHSKLVAKDPGGWLPWNFRSAIEKTENASG